MRGGVYPLAPLLRFPDRLRRTPIEERILDQRIAFYFTREPLRELARIDPDRDWRLLQQGDEAWILQTYLRLARAGLPVELVDRLPERGTLLFYAKDRHRVASQCPSLSPLVLVGVRGDRGSLRGLADLEVVQSARSAGARRVHLPFWSQPGLLPRDPARGTRLERVAFKGYLENLHPELRNPAWGATLAARGVEWVGDAVAYAGGSHRRDTLAWPDFRAIDAVVALRPRLRRGADKPATKLYNAWLAGVPALLGPEPGFRALRRSELDYLEITSGAEALAALERLRTDPGLYRAMVDNGRERAREFTPSAIVEVWRRLLFEELPARVAAERRDGTGRPPLGRWLARRVEVLRLSAIQDP